MDLPYGWSEQYAIKELLKVTDDLKRRVGHLEKEVGRLEREKAGRKGRKPTVGR